MDETIAAGLALLASLDVTDRAIDALEGEASRTPRDLADERSVLAELRAAAAAAAQALAATRARQAELEAELAAVEKRRDRAEKRLPTLATAGQIEATQHEIESLGHQGSALETGILEAMMEIEGLEEEAAGKAKTAEHAAELLARHEAAWAAREPGLRQELAARQAERGPMVSELRSDALRRYEGGRRFGLHPPRSGITWVDSDSICRTCQTRIPPRWVQEVRSAAAFHACDTCKRVLVAMEEPVEDAPAE